MELKQAWLGKKCHGATAATAKRDIGWRLGLQDTEKSLKNLQKDLNSRSPSPLSQLRFSSMGNIVSMQLHKELEMYSAP